MLTCLVNWGRINLMIYSLADSHKLYTRNFENILLNLKKKLKFLKFFEKNAENRLFEAIEYSFSNGGKRLRPVLALMTADAVAKKSEPGDVYLNPALGLALAIELIHCGSLVHDDLPCMDNDELRRGKPTSHIMYGEDIALLAGDYLLVNPISVFIEYSQDNLSLDAKLVLKVSQNILIAVQKMIIGQAMDLELARENVNTDEQTETYIKKRFEESKLMQEYKTGALLSAAIVNAAILAGATDEEVFALERYSKNLGLAFQIADDILDHTASTEEMGKKTQKDAEQNKLTYVDIYGLEEARKISEDLIKEAKEIIETTSIYSDKLKLIADYVISRNN